MARTIEAAPSRSRSPLTAAGGEEASDGLEEDHGERPGAGRGPPRRPRRGGGAGGAPSVRSEAKERRPDPDRRVSPRLVVVPSRRQRDLPGPPAGRHRSRSGLDQAPVRQGHLRASAVVARAPGGGDGPGGMAADRPAPRG